MVVRAGYSIDNVVILLVNMPRQLKYIHTVDLVQDAVFMVVLPQNIRVNDKYHRSKGAVLINYAGKGRE